jgi:hypothetical protein
MEARDEDDGERMRVRDGKGETARGRGETGLGYKRWEEGG